MKQQTKWGEILNLEEGRCQKHGRKQTQEGECGGVKVETRKDEKSYICAEEQENKSLSSKKCNLNNKKRGDCSIYFQWSLSSPVLLMSFSFDF